MPRSSPRSPAAHDTPESDQLPEEHPGAAQTGTSSPGERKGDVGLNPRPEPGSRKNTGNPHDHD